MSDCDDCGEYNNKCIANSSKVFCARIKYVWLLMLDVTTAKLHTVEVTQRYIYLMNAGENSNAIHVDWAKAQRLAPAIPPSTIRLKFLNFY